MRLFENYSLWLKANGEAGQKLQNTIDSLAKKYNTMPFKPHVTLVGLMYKPKNEVVEKAEPIAKQLKPYTIKLQDLFYTNAYYGCLMIKAERSPQVMHANRVAQDIFDLGEIYVPHLSLIYGEIDKSEKKKIISEIGDDLKLEFKVDSVAVYYTGDYVKDWLQVKEFKFQG